MKPAVILNRLRGHTSVPWKAIREIQKQPPRWHVWVANTSVLRNLSKLISLRAYLQPRGLAGVMAANTALQLSGTLIGLVSGIIVNALLGRYLGKEGYGYFSLAL
jgi:hypothetical protein